MPLWKQHLLSRYMDEASDESGQGSGGGGGGDDLQAQIRAAVEKEVAGLKSKNQELIGLNKTLKENLSRFDGIDPEAVSAMLKRFADDEEAGLIKAGKVDEVLNRRTERMKSDHEKQLQKERAEAERLKAANARLADRALAETIMKAASKAGALPEAMDDIVFRAKASGFRINADGEVVSMTGDEVVLGKDGKSPLTAFEWADSLRETAPHLWPRAQGTGALGSGGNNKPSAKTLTQAKSRDERVAVLNARLAQAGSD